MSSPFVGASRALYEYVPQEDQAPDDEDREVSISEGELLYVIEKADDGWWKVKKKALPNEEDGEVGLVPANYLEDATPISNAKALYDYDRQTSEEITLQEDSDVAIFDKDDEDWYFVSVNHEFGFAPSNYLEEGDVLERPQAGTAPTPSAGAGPAPVQQLEPQPEPESDDLYEDSLQEPTPEPAAVSESRDTADVNEYVPEDEEEPPPQPTRPQRPAEPASPSDAYGDPNEHYAVRKVESAEQAPAKPPRPGLTGTNSRDGQRSGSVSSGNFRSWQVQEVHGKKKKIKATLGVGNEKIIHSPEGRQGVRTWEIANLVSYSQEKKHIFIELDAPPAAESFDFHAGSTSTAEEIAAHLGLVAGAARAAGLRDIATASGAPMRSLPEDSALARKNQVPEPEYDQEEIDVPEMAHRQYPKHTSSSKKYGVVLYDFEAQGEDELSARANTEVEILDDKTSEDWWKCRLGGNAGVIPSSYIERGQKKVDMSRPRSSESKPGWTERQTDRPSSSSSRKNRESSKVDQHKSLPDLAKVRTWTDRSGSFKVDAQLVGYADGKINLHKLNGVKISVPSEKMSKEDVKYVEKVVNRNKEVARQNEEKEAAMTAEAIEASKRAKSPSSPDIAAIARQQAMSRKPYDWFEFFLNAGIDVHVCTRYATAFENDHLDDTSLEDLTPGLMRSLGLREGDIIRVKKHLDKLLGREPRPQSAQDIMGPPSSSGANDIIQDEGKRAESPLFTSSETGALRNNTRKGRPTPKAAASDIVEPAAFSRQSSESPPPTPQKPKQAAANGFEDDAWTVKPNNDKVEQPEPQRMHAQGTGAVKDLQDLAPSPVPPQQTQKLPSPPAMPAMQPKQPLQQPLVPQPTKDSQSYQHASAPVSLQPTGPVQQQRTGFQPLDLQSQLPPFQGRAFTPGSSFGAQLTGQQPMQQSRTGGQYSMDQLNAQMQQQRLMAQSTGPYQQAQYTNGIQQHPTGFNIMPLQQQQPMPMQSTGFPQQQQMQPTGFGQPQMQPTGFGQPQMQPTGFGQPQQMMPPMQNGFGQMQQYQPQGPMMTGYQPQFPMQQQGFPPQGGPTYMPQPMMPQQQSQYDNMSTGMQQQPFQQPQYNGFNPQFQQPMQNQAQDASMFRPAQFGLEPQKTGKANIYNATPENPFGFD